MSFWGEVKTKISSTIKEIQKNPILDAFATSALESIPVIGGLLNKVYENSKDSPEDKTTQLIQILENIQKFDQEEFNKLTEILTQNREVILTNKESLSRLLSITDSIVLRLDQIQELLEELKEQELSGVYELKTKIENLQKELVKEIKRLNPSSSKFKHYLPSERLIFYLNLQTILKNAFEIYNAQNEIAHKLCDKLLNQGHKVSGDKQGLDYALYELHDKMDYNDRKTFQYIRKVTDDTRDFNSHAKDLLLVNEELVEESPKLKELLRHYSIWQAKYELYKKNPSMCLIYVGPDQNAKFPDGLDSEIIQKIKQLKEETNLSE